MPTTTPAELTAAAAFRYLGVTDECVDCQKCGRADLRSTVVLALLDADGNVEAVTYYGSTCAARALHLGRGGARTVVDAARAAHRHTVDAARDARQSLAFYSLDPAVVPVGFDLDVAAWKYRRAHAHAVWAPTTYAPEWRAMVLAMHARHAAAIRDAELLGV